MNREQAESLLAQLVFDDLEDAVRSELLAYLKTDAALSERLGDMRLTAKLLHDAVEVGETPKLDERHKADLHKRIEQDKRRRGVMGVMTKPIGGRLAAYSALAAACFLIVALLLPSLGAARRSAKQMANTTQARGTGLAMEVYAQNNKGRYPERVSQLVEDGYVLPQYLIAADSDVIVPSDFENRSQQEQNEWIDQNSSFKLMAGGEKSGGIDNEKIIGYMEHGGGKGVSVARGDGRASYEQVEDLPELFGEGAMDSRIVASLEAPVTVQQPSETDLQMARIDAARRKLAVKDAQLGYTVDGSMGGYGGQVTEAETDQFILGREALPLEGERTAVYLYGNFAAGEISVNSMSSEGLALGDDVTIGGNELSSPTVEGSSFGDDLAVTRWGRVARQQIILGDGVCLENGSASEYCSMQQMQAVSPQADGLGVAGSGGGEMGGYGGGAWYYGKEDGSGVVALNEPVDELASAGVAVDILTRRVEPTGTRDIRWLGEPMSPGSAPVPATSSASVQTPPSVVNSPTFDLTDSLSSAETNDDMYTLAIKVKRLHRGVELQAAAQEGDLAGGASLLYEELREVPADWPQITSRRMDANSEDQIVLGTKLELDKATEELDTEERALVLDTIQDQERYERGRDVQPARKPRLMPVNPWVMAADDRLSTFALDVDTASYGIARRYIRDGFLPPRHTVRMEEFVNSFDYNYPTGQLGSEAFTVHAEAGPSPFGQDTVLLKVGVRGKVVGRDRAKPAHLVFVIDTSGSMDRDDRLPLVRQSLAMVLDQLSDNDRVTVVGYGTEARLLVESAPGGDKQRILDAVESLQTGGSTNLIGGVALGYEVAQRHYITGGVNRVILCSDGVANVGSSEADDLLDQAGSLRKQGVTFTSVGFGAGNYDDRVLEQLANKGDGGYLFVGSFDEAKRVFVDDMAATRPTIAFDAKIQVDFDPARVRRYRLIGYENCDIADADFRNDTVDAGEVGSGQSATALYELELYGPMITTGDEPDLGTVFVRYRDADTGRVREIESRLTNDQIARRSSTSDARFYLAASAARFAEVLRGSEHVTEPDIGRNLAEVQSVLETVAAQFPMDQSVQELLEMVCRAQGLPRAE